MLAWERDLNLIIYKANQNWNICEVVYQSCSKRAPYCMVSPLDADKNRTKVS